MYCTLRGLKVATDGSDLLSLFYLAIFFSLVSIEFMSVNNCFALSMYQLNHLSRFKMLFKMPQFINIMTV